MLWYKAWLETRWRFLIGFALLALSACGTVFGYPRISALLSQMPPLDLDGVVGRRINETAELARSYQGFVWSQWFRQNLLQMWALFAALLGTGGLLSQASGGGALFTLSLPATRSQLVAARAGTGLAQLLVLALVPPLLLPVLSPAIGQTFSVVDSLVYGSCIFIAGTVFYALAFLLSTIFTDVWRPFLIVAGLGLVEQFSSHFTRFSVFRVMSAESYFRGNGLPWFGLLATAALAAGLLYAANRNIARQDF